MGCLVIQPGMFTTVQDAGRWGYQHLGVPVAGPMDMISHRLANQLVGNPEAAATLEVTVTGPELVFDAPTVFAVTGAEFGLSLDGGPMVMNMGYRAEARQTLRFGRRRLGARAYLGLAGGIDVPPVLGSRSTHTTSGIGGLAGRALRAGDRFSVSAPPELPESGRSRAALTPLPREGIRVRVLEGPDVDLFDPGQVDALCSTRYRITSEANRMGYRLEGRRLTRSRAEDPLSSAIPNGSVQVPASGDPIILLADHQTVGGYPRIATIISADLPVLGQLMASQWVEFSTCSLETARRELVGLERSLIA